eukprot:gene1459-biopygen9352
MCRHEDGRLPSPHCRNRPQLTRLAATRSHTPSFMQHLLAGVTRDAGCLREDFCLQWGRGDENEHVPFHVLGGRWVGTSAYTTPNRLAHRWCTLRDAFGASVGRPRAGGWRGGVCFFALFVTGGSKRPGNSGLRAAIRTAAHARSGRANDTGGLG